MVIGAARLVVGKLLRCADSKVAEQAAHMSHVPGDQTWDIVNDGALADQPVIQSRADSAALRIAPDGVEFWAGRFMAPPPEGAQCSR